MTNFQSTDRHLLINLATFFKGVAAVPYHFTNFKFRLGGTLLKFMLEHNHGVRDTKASRLARNPGCGLVSLGWFRG